MKLNRFIGAFSFASPNVLISERETVHQFNDVLKLKRGDSVVLCDGRGEEVVARIEKADRRTVELEIIEKRNNLTEPEREVILYCAILKRENFELAVQKAVEVGVSSIIPLVTDRTIKLNIKRERIEKIIKEAAEQSGRGVIPPLGEPMNFETGLENADANKLNIFFDVAGKAELITKGKFPVRPMGRAGIFIGPEGGWSEQEVRLATEKKFSILNLGPRVLRAETAVTIATYLMAL